MAITFGPRHGALVNFFTLHLLDIIGRMHKLMSQLTQQGHDSPIASAATASYVSGWKHLSLSLSLSLSLFLRLDTFFFSAEYKGRHQRGPAGLQCN